MTIYNFALLICALGLSCSGVSKECSDFFSQPVEQAEAKFRTYPIEKQFDLFSCGMRMEPQVLWPAADLADRGDPAIPFLLDRLKKESDELSQDDIIFVFELMSSKGYLDNKPFVIDELTQIVSKMKNPSVKNLSQEKLRRIEAKLRERKENKDQQVK
jgi:hypothetical protein